MAGRAVMRMRTAARKATMASALNDKARKQIPGHFDYLGELRRYHHFWECVRSGVNVEKHKLSDHCFFEHHKHVVTSVEHMKHLR